MMLTTQLLILTLAQISNVLGSAQKSDISPQPYDPSTLISEYQQKICNHSATCSLVKSVPPSYRDLRTRNCMCDKKCTLYRDCCTDSAFQPDPIIAQHKFSCEKTAKNDFVYIKTSCPPSWNDSEYVQKQCEVPNFHRLTVTLDNWIWYPVTNLTTGITYRNMFCALCHKENVVDVWVPFSFHLQNISELQFELYHFNEHILANWSPNDEPSDGGWKYAGDVTDGWFYHQKVYKNANLMRYCVPSVADTCSSNWTGPSSCPNYTSYAYAGDKVYKNLDCLACNYVPRPSTCDHPSPPSESITSLLTVKLSHNIIPQNIHRTDVIERLLMVLTDVSCILSIICLVAHLFVFQHLSAVKTLSEKNLAAFSFTMLMAFLSMTLGNWLPSCEIKFVINNYSMFSCFVWMLIMAYDCWQSIFNATMKLQAPGGNNFLRFILYCILGWIVPFLVVCIVVFFELFPPRDVQLKQKHEYNTYKQCFIKSDYVYYKIYFIPMLSMFIAIVVFFTCTAIMIFSSQRSTINPTTRGDLKLYTRLAVMVGLPWPLLIFSILLEHRYIILFNTIMCLSQGIFIFFGYTVNQKTIKQLQAKHKNNPTVLRFLSKFGRDNVSKSDRGAFNTTKQTSL